MKLNARSYEGKTFFFCPVPFGGELFFMPMSFSGIDFFFALEKESARWEGVRQGISFESFRNTRFSIKREGCRKLSCEIVPEGAVLAVTFKALYLCKGKVVHYPKA